MNYKHMTAAVQELLESEPDWLANFSNISAIIKMYMTDLNWSGFYLMKDSGLVLGPFQGRPACIRIAVGKGVCGTCAHTGKTVVVPDVHLFPGHIACDADTCSEIVLPIFRDGELFAVLDLDSAELDRFSPLEQKYLEQLAGMISEFLSIKNIAAAPLVQKAQPKSCDFLLHK